MHIGLFIPSYIDAFFPKVGIATLVSADGSCLMYEQGCAERIVVPIKFIDMAQNFERSCGVNGKACCCSSHLPASHGPAAPPSIAASITQPKMLPFPLPGHARRPHCQFEREHPFDLWRGRIGSSHRGVAGSRGGKLPPSSGTPSRSPRSRWRLSPVANRRRLYGRVRDAERRQFPADRKSLFN
jgi:hypothetical protein